MLHVGRFPAGMEGDVLLISRLRLREVLRLRDLLCTVEPCSPRSLIRFSKWLLGTFQVIYTVREKNMRDEIIGFIGIYEFVAGSSFFFSFGLAPSSRGRGFGLEAIQLFLEGLGRKGFRETVFASVPKTNTASSSLLRKVGFFSDTEKDGRLLFERKLCGGDPGK